MSAIERRHALCMVVHGPYPVGEPRVARQAAAALAAGWDVEVVAMRRPGERRTDVVDGVKVFRLPLSHARGVGPVRLAVEYLGFAALAAAKVTRRALGRRFDVVQVHAPPDFLIVSALGARILGSRVVLDIHDPSPEMLATRFSGPSARTAAFVLRRIERVAGALADAVVTVHEPYRRELIARGIAPRKVNVVMNSVDESLLPPAEHTSRSPFRVVYHGTVTPSYGVPLLVDAAAQLLSEVADFELEIIGEGDAIPSVVERAREVGLSGHVAIDGAYLPQRQALARINGASVGVIPNLPSPLNHFALSSKLLEYVALGIPVVSASLPTISEHFSDDEVRFFEPGDVDSLAEALLDVHRDPDAAAVRARRAKQRYSEYRWEANAETYLAILDQLASGARAGRAADRRDGIGG